MVGSLEHHLRARGFIGVAILGSNLEVIGILAIGTLVVQSQEIVGILVEDSPLEEVAVDILEVGNHRSEEGIFGELPSLVVVTSWATASWVATS